MSDRLVAINVLPGSTGEEIDAFLDGGNLVAALKVRGLMTVIITEDTFVEGAQSLKPRLGAEVGEPLLFERVDFDPAEVVAVRNHVIPRSGTKHLAGFNVLNPESVRQFASDRKSVREALGTFALLEGMSSEVSLPAGVRQITEGGAAVSPEAGLALKALVVRSNNSTTVVTFGLTTDGAQVDVDLRGELRARVGDMSSLIFGRVALETDATHFMGVLTVVEDASGRLYVPEKKVGLKAPRVPTSVGAPAAAEIANEAIARTLAAMAEEA